MEGGTGPAARVRAPAPGEAVGVLPGLVVVLTVLTLELVRFSGPLLDSAYGRGGAPAVAVTAVLTYAAPAPVVALLLAATRRAARPRSAALLGGAVVLALLRLGVQGLVGEVRVVLGLVTVAVALAVLALAVSVLAGRAGGGPAAAAAVLGGAAGSVALQLALGTWDAPWRHTALGWSVATGLAVALVLLAVLAAREPAGGAVGPGGRLWALGPALALGAMLLANPAFAAAQSGLPLAGAGPALGLGLLLAAVLAGRRPSSSGRARPAVVALAAAVVVVAGTAVALQVPGSTPAARVLVVTALLAAQVSTAVLLRRAWSQHSAAPGSPAPQTRLRATATVVAAGVAGLTTIVPLLLFQLDYDVPLGVPNVLVLVATAAGLAVAGLVGSGTTGPGPGHASDVGTARTSRRPLVAATALLAVGTAVAVVGAAQARATTVGPVTGRVVSWNLHYGVSPAGGVDLEAVARVIEAEDPDVVLLQEVSRGWVQGGGADMATWLSARLDRPFAFAPAADRRFGNVVLARHPLTDVRVQPLPFGAGPQRRSALTAVTRVGSRPTTVTSLHLQHRATNAPTRLAQLETFLGAPAAPVHVVGGDLNAVPGSSEVRLLGDAGYVSAVGVAGDPTALTDPSTAPTRRIDWVFGRGVEFTRARVLTGVELSDHLPLVVEVRP